MALDVSKNCKLYAFHSAVLPFSSIKLHLQRDKEIPWRDQETPQKTFKLSSNIICLESRPGPNF